MTVQMTNLKQQQLQPEKEILSALLEQRCDEIALESQAETCGGRLGHETPEGLSSKLQIDSLTEDGDETEFREELLNEAPNGGEEDAVEAFSLDPEFDYDNPPEGMSGKIDPNDLRLLREVSGEEKLGCSFHGSAP
ncbi:unnamed protein product [Symbiodinium sp. CCMP2592]|nr:unnamed protein product [Symbiodinium sp. CCMP2592]